MELNKNIKKFKKVQIIRRLVQIVSFILLPTLYIETYSSIKAIYISLLRKSFNWETMLPEILILIIVVGTSAILGRFFCGWICGFGSFMDLLYFGSKKVLKTKYRVPEKIDIILKLIKYIIFIFSLLFVWSFQSTFLNNKDPWYSFAQFPNIKAMIFNAPIAFLLLIVIIIGSIFIERFFCRYLCPLGAVFVIISKLRIFKISKPREKCGKCRLCTHQCIMGIKMYKTDVIKDSECIDCFKCIGVCPKKTIAMKIEPRGTINPAIAAGVAVTIIAGGSEFINVSNKIKSDNITYFSMDENKNSSNSEYNDGIYDGIAEGFKSYNNVQVTIKDGRINQIKPLDVKDTTDAFNKAFSRIAPEILKTQSFNVDSVTGATYSSDGIIKAVENALQKAKKNNIQINDLNKNVQENVSKNINKYKDGIYDGVADGFKEYNNVQVIIRDGKIVQIKPLDIRDTTDAFNKAFSRIAPEVLKTQSLKVDTVTGATYSSNGIIKAVQDALNKAKQ